MSTEMSRMPSRKPAAPRVLARTRKGRPRTRVGAADLERRLAERTAELRDKTLELERFAFTVSHDLRAPLRAMQGFARALIEDCGDRLDPVGRDYAARIAAAGRRMDGMLQDLLAYSRLLRLDRAVEPVDLKDIVAEALHGLDPAVRGSDARVVVEDGLPRVLGHRALLVQVIGCLLSNAVKFVAPGTRPEVRLRGEDRAGRLRLWVEDNGIGIAPGDQEKIFGVFVRLHGVEAYPGNGMGLAIVRRGMERMSGGSGVDSRTGSGSRFWIELPKGPKGA